MATTIYKISSYVNWNAEGTGVVSKGVGGGIHPPTDLSNYYTKTNLQTPGQSFVHFANVTEAYHNDLLGLQGGDEDSGGDSSGFNGAYYHLSEAQYLALSTGMITGSGADNQVAVFTGANAIEGTAGLTYTGTLLTVSGKIGLTDGLDNVAIGVDSLYSNITRQYNVAIGTRALYSLNYTDQSDCNVAIGHESQYSSVNGGYNTTVGYQAGYGATDGNLNTALGYQALYVGEDSINTAYSCIAIGYQALYNHTGLNNIGIGNLALGNGQGDGASNIGIGDLTLYEITSGSGNIAIGESCLTVTTTGFNNIAIGGIAMFVNVSGKENIAIGTNALFYNVAGHRNIAIGISSLSNATGSDNIGIGWDSMMNTIGGTKNIALGYQSLHKNTTGSTNIAIGELAGSYYGVGTSSNTAATNSIFIGKSTKAAANSQTNQIVIGDQAIGKGSNTAVWGSTSITDHYFTGDIHTHISVANTKLGVGAGNSLYGGDYNSILGNNALNSATTANYCVAIGYYALYQNTSSYNIGIGNTAGQVITSAQYIIAIGHDSFCNMTSGGNALAIGGNAGRYIANGSTPLTISTNSIFIGHNAKANADSETNQIVIGYDAIGTGSNTVVLGNTSIIQTTLRGTVLTDLSSTTRAGLRLPHGTAPTSPVNGDIWTTTSGLYAYINSVTIGPFGTGAVKISGTPVNYQIAIWTNSTTIKGSANFTYTTGTSTFYVIGDIQTHVISSNTKLGVSAGSNFDTGGSTGVSNTAIGEGALAACIYGSINTAIGGYALGLYGESTGQCSTAIGGEALYSCLSGNNNVAVGYQALYTIGVSSGNVAVGVTALQHLSSGNYNTAIGEGALGWVDAGCANNIALGWLAGTYLSNDSTANALCNNSVFIGYRTHPNASGETNQIVIGYQAVGTGSNTIVLGHTTITQTTLRGNLVVNEVTAPAGTPASGYGYLYVNSSDSKIYYKNDAGTVYDLTATGGAGNTFSMSLVDDSVGNVTLVNDATSPGNSKYYGTNGSGTKGFYDLPAGSGGNVSNTGTPVNNQVAVWTDATTIEGTAGLTYDNDNILTVSGTSASLLCSGTFEGGWSEPNLGAGVRMLWCSYNCSFRAGQVSGTQWNYANNGYHSFAVGQNTTASGARSAALGYATIASGSNSFVANSTNTASGTHSTAFGFSSLSESYTCFVIGRYNVGGGTVSSWVSTESVFEIGIGASSGARANAVTVLKDGTVKLSQTLKVNHIAEYTASHNIFFDNDIQTHSDNSNTILGVDSFKHYVSSQWSVGIGYQALHASTTGNFNVAIGATAGVGITTGTENTVIGNQCFCTASNATHNIAIGSGTMYNLTSGDYNVAIGNNALYALVDNDMNVAIGYHAAQFTSTFFSVTDCGNSIYIGANVHPLNATGDYNEIVIGYEAIGAGANTVVLGNTSITQTTLRGTVLTDATSTTRAGLRLPHGTAPSSPTNGDIWTTTAGMYARINSVTIGPFGTGSGTNYWQKTGTDISPATAGDDLLIPVTDLIKFGDGDTYIYEPSDDVLKVFLGTYETISLATDIGKTTMKIDTTGQFVSWSSKWVMEPQSVAGTTGLDLEIRSGVGTATHGSLYFISKISSQTAGNYYFGTGSVGNLPTKSAETDVVYYDSTTGKISYGAGGGGTTPVDSTLLDWSTNQYIPYASRGAGGEFYSGSATVPNQTTMLNYNGNFVAGAIGVVTSLVVGITTGFGLSTYNAYIETNRITLYETYTTPVLDLHPGVGDSATAVAYLFNTVDDIVTPGAKLASWKNNGSEKAFINKDGSILANMFIHAYMGVSDIVQISHDSETSTGNTSYTVLKTITLGIYLQPGRTLRIKFDLKRDQEGPPYVYGQIYRNGSPIGTERSTSSSTYQTYSEDIINWDPSDIIGLYAYADSGYYAYIRNFRVCGSMQNTVVTEMTGSTNG